MFCKFAYLINIKKKSLAVGKVFTLLAVKKVPKKMTSVSAVGFFFFIFIKYANLQKTN